MATKSTKKTATKQSTTDTPDYKQILTDSLDLSFALVNEIDNIMGSKLAPGQIGKVLGDVVTGYHDNIKKFKSQAELS